MSRRGHCVSLQSTVARSRTPCAALVSGGFQSAQALALAHSALRFLRRVPPSRHSCHAQSQVSFSSFFGAALSAVVYTLCSRGSRVLACPTHPSTLPSVSAVFLQSSNDLMPHPHPHAHPIRQWQHDLPHPVSIPHRTLSTGTSSCGFFLLSISSRRVHAS